MPSLIAMSVSWYLWSAIVFGLATIGIVLLFGVHALRSDTTSSAMFSEVISHTVGSLALFVGMCVFVPQYSVIFENFDVELPATSILLMSASYMVAKYFYLVAPLLLAMIAADAVIFHMLHKRESTRTSARIFSVCITAVLEIAILFSTVALVGPLMTLANELE